MKKNIKEKESKTEEEIQKTLCPIPFSALILNPDGRVGCCREQTNHDIIGNIKDESWDEIWNGENIRKWRREFLTGNIKKCAHLINTRFCNKNEYNMTLLPHTDFSEYQSNPPIQLSADFNGLCNLECVMCDIWNMENGLYDKISFWEVAERELFPHVKYIDLLAGEPFVQKDTYRLIKIVSEKAPQAQWRFTTNGNWHLSNYVRDHLNKIDNLYSIQTSIDGATDKTYSEIRKKGKFPLVMKNLQEQMDYNDEREKCGLQRFKMKIMMTVMVQNWREIPLMCRLAESLNVESEYAECEGPERMMINRLPEIEKVRILDYLFGELEAKDYSAVRQIFIIVIKTLNPTNQLKYKKLLFAKTGYLIPTSADR